MRTGWDIDGVMTSPVFDPQPGDVVISGRTFSEYDWVCKGLAAMMPVYVRGTGAYGDRVAAADFKIEMIQRLEVDRFYEDDPYQADIIAEHCPGVEVVRVEVKT